MKMQRRPESTYLHTFLIWGARQYDPANIDNLKSVNKEQRRQVFQGKVFPKKPTSRHLSHHVSNYQT